MAKSRVYFENLDALRFIAFFMVFITHGISPIFHILFGESGIKILLMGLGAQGVSIFFVLSGFLIKYLILKEIEINGKLNIFSFYSRRFLRIWPLFFLVMIHGFWFYPFLHRLFGNEIIVCSNPIYNFLFLNNFDALALTINQSSCFEPHITTSWSVAIEEQFYLVWPILFLVIRPKNYIWIFISVFMVSLAFRIYNYNNSWLLYFHTLGASGDLAIGGFFAYMSLNSKKWLAFFANLSNSSRLIFYISAILIFILRNHIFVYEYCLVFKR